MDSLESPKVYGYGRASTQNQVESPEIQKLTITSYCRTHAKLSPLAPPTFMIDKATSGGTPIAERNAGKILCGRLKRGDHVVVSKLDRGFRSLMDFVKTAEHWRHLGVSLHVCDCGIDFSSDWGLMTLQILAVFAEFERKLIASRMREGFQRKRAKGQKWARDPGYGFKWEKRRVDGESVLVRVKDEREREVMRGCAIRRMADPQWEWRQIEHWVNEELCAITKDGKRWSLSRIQRATKAEFMLMAKEKA